MNEDNPHISKKQSNFAEKIRKDLVFDAKFD